MLNLMLAAVEKMISTMPMVFSQALVGEHNISHPQNDQQVGDMMLDMAIGMMILELISTVLMPTSLRRWVGVRLPTHDPLIGGR